MEMTQKQKNANKNRFVITAVVLGTFFLIMSGIGWAILNPQPTPNINQEWKEILLLVLGAFLGSYSRIIDFWFNGKDDEPSTPDPVVNDSVNYCDNCGNDLDPTDNF